MNAAPLSHGREELFTALCLKKSSRKRTLLPFAIGLLLIGPSFSQELRFLKEKITVNVHDGYCRVRGTYFLKNAAATPVTRIFYYPVAVNATMPFPHFWRVENPPSTSLPFAVGDSGISFSKKIAPHSMDSFQVEYQQKTARRAFEYVLTSTSSWKAPIDSAEIVVLVPKKFKLQSISIPYDRVIQRRDRLEYIITRSHFFPNKNLFINWEDRADETVH